MLALAPSVAPSGVGAAPLSPLNRVAILAELVRLDRLVVVADFAVDAPKTKGLVAKLDTLGLKDVLIVTDGVDENLYLAARNLAHVDVRDVQGSDPVSLIAYDKVLVTVSAVKKFEELLG